MKDKVDINLIIGLFYNTYNIYEKSNHIYNCKISSQSLQYYQYAHRARIVQNN